MTYQKILSLTMLGINDTLKEYSQCPCRAGWALILITALSATDRAIDTRFLRSDLLFIVHYPTRDLQRRLRLLIQ